MEYVLEVRNIVKRFGGLTAVNNVSMGVKAGEVVGLLGDNGAGKSTLIKVVSGVYRADEGKVLFQGKEVDIGSPMDALAMGIETIYQDLALAENLNTPANIFLGREKMKKSLGILSVLDHKYMHEESRKVLEKLDILIPSLRNRIRAFSGGQRQAVAISRSIYWDAKFLIMDEPTAALGVAEQKKVLDLVNRLKSHGIGVIVISHQMHDVFSVADRLVIMRRGEKVAELITKETNADEVVSLIVGSGDGDVGPGGATGRAMKLFTKTLLFFIGVIVFQSALTILLITNVTRRANLSDAQKELEDEAAILYDSFNSWKRQIWISLISIRNDRGLARQPFDERERSLREKRLSTKVDALILEDVRGFIPDIVQGSPGSLETLGPPDASQRPAAPVHRAASPSAARCAWWG